MTLQRERTDSGDFPFQESLSGRLLGPFARRFFPAIPTYRSTLSTLLAFTALGLVMSVLFLAIVKPTYTATAIVGPTQEQYTPTPSSQLDRNGFSLLSGGGLLSGPRIITPYDVFLQAIHSREVAASLFADPAIREGLFPGSWDAETKSWRPIVNLRSEIAAPIYWLINRPHATVPTVGAVQNLIRGKLEVSMIDRGPMYTITFSSPDRAFAIAFLQQAFLATDRVVKQQNRAEVLRRIDALKNRMNSVDVVAYRSQFTDLVMDQEKQLMVLQGNGPFAATMVVSPGAGDFPDSPRVFVTIPIFMAFFFFFGATILSLFYRDQIMSSVRKVGKAQE